VPGRHLRRSGRRGNVDTDTGAADPNADADPRHADTDVDATDADSDHSGECNGDADGHPARFDAGNRDTDRPGSHRHAGTFGRAD